MREPSKPTLKKKQKYYVFASAEPNDLSASNFEASTWAVSEKQAINNVRHNNYGDEHSQHKDGWFWNAILAE